MSCITSTILLATVSFVEPTASLSYVEATAQATYIKPVATAKYFDISVCAEVTMPDVLGVDIVTPTDLVTLATSKSLSDTTNGFTDNTVLAVGKSLLDTFTMQDSTDIEYLIGKQVVDTQFITESLAKGFTTSFTDSAVATDLYVGTYSKALDDALSAPTDSLDIKNVDKGIADSATMSDSIYAVLVFIRELSDSIASSDLAALSNDLPKTDAISTADAQVLGLGKGIIDSVVMIDNMDGDIEYDIIKLVGELLTSTDNQNIAFAPYMTDNVSSGSSGVLMMQDYSDITYFLEDYVGTSRTFT